MKLVEMFEQYNEWLGDNSPQENMTELVKAFEGMKAHEGANPGENAALRAGMTFILEVVDLYGVPDDLDVLFPKEVS